MVQPVQPTVKSQQSKEEKASLVAVFGGPMVNPLTEDRFTSEASKAVLLDWWIKSQMEAGKLATSE